MRYVPAAVRLVAPHLVTYDREPFYAQAKAQHCTARSWGQRS